MIVTCQSMSSHVPLLGLSRRLTSVVQFKQVPEAKAVAIPTRLANINTLIGRYYLITPTFFHVHRSLL